jgi:hypothetical protein
MRTAATRATSQRNCPPYKIRHGELPVMPKGSGRDGVGLERKLVNRDVRFNRMSGRGIDNALDAAPATHA